MTYEHKVTHEEDFDIDKDILEPDGWEIISVSQGMIYWKRKVFTGGYITEKRDDYTDIKPYIPPTIIPHPEPYTWPKGNEIYVTFNNVDTNEVATELVQTLTDKIQTAIQTAK